MDSFVPIVDASEEQSRTPVFGAFGGLLNRTVITGDEMPKEPDGTFVIIANFEFKQFVPSISMLTNQESEPVFESQALPDTSITSAEEVSVMSDEGALWTADLSLGAIPEVPAPPEPEKTLFDLEYTPEFDESEPESEAVAPTPPLPPKISVQFGPSWEPDELFDRSKAVSISDNERTILEAAAGREVLSSDVEL